MKSSLTFCLLLYTCFIAAQDPKIQWVNTFFDPGFKNGSLAEFLEIQTNATGKTAVLGVFKSNLELGLGSPLSSKDNTQSYFVAQFDSDGALLWAHTISGPESQTAADTLGGIEIDDTGNVYVYSRFFADSLRFDATHAFERPCVADCQDAFLAKYDPAGQFLWMKTISSGFPAGNFISSEGIELAADGDLFLSGSYSDNTLIFDQTTFDKLSSNGVFLARLNPEGQVRWLHTSKQSNGSAFAQLLSVAPNGDVWMGGYYDAQNLDFGNNIKLDFWGHPKLLNIFVTRISADGQAKEALNFNTAVEEIEPYLLDLSIDEQNVLYLLFDYGDNLRRQNTLIRQYFGYAAQLFNYKDGQLNSMAFLPHGPVDFPMIAMAIGPNGRYYTGGFFEKTINIPGFGNLVAAGAQDMLLTSASLQISQTKAFRYGGLGFEGAYTPSGGRCIRTDKAGSLYVAGQYQDDMKLGAFSEDGKGLFLCKIDWLLGSSAPQLSHYQLKVNPGIAAVQEEVQVLLPADEGGPGLLQIFDLQGSVIQSQKVYGTFASFRAELPPGAYTLLYTGESIAASGRLVVIR
jgi:hypothetical protein